MPLPELPRIRLELIDELPTTGAGFLSLRRQRMRLHYEDGSSSEPFVYDTVERAALDAVVIVATYVDAEARRHVFLRSAVRPPIATRPSGGPPTIWEAPAGLVEPDEQGELGLRRCAARELWEEVGLRAAADDFEPLGPPLYVEPGTIGERHHYFCVEVDPARRQAPAEDGSVLERRASVVAVALDEALAWLASGGIEDSKTEIALRRLGERDRAR